VTKARVGVGSLVPQSSGISPLGRIEAAVRAPAGIINPIVEMHHVILCEEQTLGCEVKAGRQ
jgi:hypothetical protein